MDEIKITINHVMQAHGCARGALLFCRRHGLDAKKLFSGDGIPLSDFEHIDDAVLQRVIEAAKRGW